MNKAAVVTERLDFVLPDFTRLSWVSERAKEAWEPRLKQIAKAWSEIEWLSVMCGIRCCCITTASPEEFVQKAGEWVKHGLSALPLQVQGIFNYSYSSTSVEAEPGKPFVFRFVLGMPRDVLHFKSAFDVGDDEEIGRLLGYPSCCSEFFRETWVEQELVDTTWSMAVATANSEAWTRSIEVTGSPEANILWRWMGVRAVPHLPCRFDCQHSVEFGKKLVEVGRKAGYDTEMDWLLEILSWPVEWSALHGIAEIKTPVLKVSTRTDATALKYVVRHEGSVYPLEGSQGLNFPYRTPRKPLLTNSRGFQRGLDNPIKTQSQYPEWYASDNGFNSRFVMDNAHKPIVELAVATLSSRGGNVLDLGCGNGVLLKKIRDANTEIVPFGIEIESSRLESVRMLLPEFADNFICGDMFEEYSIWSSNCHYALAILMPGRLIEASPEQSAKLKAWLKNHCDNVLVYAYGDWLTQYKNLEGLAQKAGILLFTSDVNVSLAKIK